MPTQACQSMFVHPQPTPPHSPTHTAATALLACQPALLAYLNDQFMDVHSTEYSIDVHFADRVAILLSLHSYVLYLGSPPPRSSSLSPPIILVFRPQVSSSSVTFNIIIIVALLQSFSRAKSKSKPKSKRGGPSLSSIVRALGGGPGSLRAGLLQGSR